MKKTIIATALVLGIGTLAGCGTQSSDNTAKKDTTPKQETTGKAQSPVKIDTSKTKKDAKITNITYKYQPTSFKLIRKDQMIQATAQPAKGRPDSTINVGGKDYTLKTINIHTPAEHQIDNKKMDAELQLVHTSKDNKTVIISVLVKSGAENKAIGDLTSVVANSTNNKEQTLKTTISTLGLIPTNDKHFTYQGSLTTPATTEGVTWFVYETPITMSTKQLDQLKSKLADNNRPTQSLNERVIYSN
ncbi:carbonic anhydrase family protein [Listeria booriae]|uniref:carbonic anhydrase family protein n=1 Tax=Listeria booriae TaxID=1552123 RepID=UPI001626BF45|nr:carbonic anhydrase family protein [Listeria booriae]MBC1531185.1 carbonic anhydrase family protein [Listeria booriae]